MSGLRVTDSSGWGRLAASLCLLAAWSAPRCEAAWITGPRGERVFVRGISYAPYHPREKWALSPATQARDRKLIHDLGANCLLTWRKTSSEEVSAWQKLGLYSLPQVLFTPPKVSVYPNGQKAPVPVYVAEATRRGFHDAARDLAGALQGNPGVLVVSLGDAFVWSAYSGDLGFCYAGYDEETVGAFRDGLKTRFGTAARFGALTGQPADSLDDVVPPTGLTPRPLFGEWWQFMQRTLAGFLAQGYDGVRSVGWTCPVTYARRWGMRWDPACEGGRLPMLDVVSGNVFHEHTLDWTSFACALDRLIAGAGGKPVLLSETGAHTLRVDPQEAARTVKESIALALLHPEIAGVALYEFCDEWELGGKGDVQDDTSNAEFWGLVSGLREPKATYLAAAEMFAFIKAHETMLQEWQSAPAVLVSQQDHDWWKIGGPEAAFCERVAGELYRHGVSFQFVDNEGLQQLDPAVQPRLILCDSFLGCNPDGSGDVQARVTRFIEAGGDVLYTCSRPWQRLYGHLDLPPELAATGQVPKSRAFGKGRFTLVPSDSLGPKELRYCLEDYLEDPLKSRPVLAVNAPAVAPPAEAETPAAGTPTGTPASDAGVFWRVFQDRAGLWLYLVNVGAAPVPRLELDLAPGLDTRRVALNAADGARLGRSHGKLCLSDLDTYALVFLAPVARP